MLAVYLYLIVYNNLTVGTLSVFVKMRYIFLVHYFCVFVSLRVSIWAFK